MQEIFECIKKLTMIDIKDSDLWLENGIIFIKEELAEKFPIGLLVDLIETVVGEPCSWLLAEEVQ